jgi:hypothetical protein
MELRLYAPKHYENSKEIKDIIASLSKTGLRFDVTLFEENSEIEKNMRWNILLPISVSKRIKIKQTRRTKSLYPHLIILENNIPKTFYPQIRAGQKEISIEEFCESFSNGNTRSLTE